MIKSPYQVGGSLTTDDPSYVERQADHDLYDALKRGEFCYVLNARQMGKSSLMVRTQHRLQQEGSCCAAVDLSVIGSEKITPLQWYKGIITSLCLEFDLFGEFNLKSWWKAEEDLSFIQRFSRFIDHLLEVYFPDQQLFIFIDEVDSLLHLDFSVDDFFALIRSFYNQRAIHPIYNRITFAIFGVATPSDLIQDKTRTPFNIGNAIELKGFQWHEAQILTNNFKIKSGSQDAVLQGILYWTGGQPFLTQKLCDLVIKLSLYSENSELEITANQEKEWVSQLVRSHILENWESQDEPEHIKTIQDRLLNNPNYLGRILVNYQKILQSSDFNSIDQQQSNVNQLSEIKSDDSRETLELILSGLVIKEQGYLKVKNPIYAAIFNLQWIQQQLDQIRPYSQALKTWSLSNYQDDSRLLRGRALKEAQNWAEGKSLSDLDYRFLGASQKHDDQEIRKTLQAERAKEIEARLIEERKTAKVQQFFLEKVRKEAEIRLNEEQNRRIQEQRISQLQQLLLKGMIGAFLIVIVLIIIVGWQYRQSLTSQQQARQSEVKALVSSSEAFFASDQNMDALIAAIQATQKLKIIDSSDPQLQQRVEMALEQAVFSADEYNHLSGHNQAVLAIAFTNEGQALETFISASEDRTIKLWNRQGQLLRTLIHNDTLQAVAFSPNGQRFAVGDETNVIKLYNQDGELLSQIIAQQPNVTQLALSGNQQTLAAVSGTDTVQLWTQTGTLLGTLQPSQGLIQSLALSPNGEILASGGQDGQVKLWNRQGDLLKTLSDYHPSDSENQQTVVFSPDGEMIAVAAAESAVKLYNSQGTLLTTFKTDQSVINSIAFNPDSQILVVGGINEKIQLWSRTGNLLKTLAGYYQEVNGITFSPDGQTLAFSSSDGTIDFWRLHHPLKMTLMAHQDAIEAVKFTGDNQQFTTFCHHGIIKRWQLDGTLLQSFSLDDLENVNPNSRHLLELLSQADPTLTFWTLDQTLINRLTTQIGWTEAVAIHPQGHLIATRSVENQIQFWSPQGDLQQRLSPMQTDISEMAFSPDGQLFGLGGNHEIELWGLNGQFRRKFVSPDAEIQVWRFSPDGEMIVAVNAEGQIKLWNRDGQLLSKIQTEVEEAVDLAISPNGQHLAIVDRQHPNLIQLWDRDGILLQVLPGHQALLSVITFNPEGNLLLSADRNGQVVLWDIDAILDSNLLELGCDWVQDYLKTHEGFEESERNLCNAVQAASRNN